MPNKIELLAPGGDIDAIKAAIIAGADAIYCGLNNFNARKRAANISFEQLELLLDLAHRHHSQIFLTLNILIVEQELSNLYQLLNKLANSQIDGVIVQDIGLFHIIQRDFPNLRVHASTQVTLHNQGQLHLYHKLGTERVNLSRELNIDEISTLTQTAHKLNIATEVFVHGSNCIGFSGLCYFSSVHGGASGNRGRCSQPCRDEYQATKTSKHYPFNLKDNSAFDDLEALSQAGVDSIKVEGRIKKPHYVYSVIGQWRKRLDAFEQGRKPITNRKPLEQVFNRDFTNGYLKGEINHNMFIDQPKDNAPYALAKTYQSLDSTLTTDMALNRAKRDLYDSKTEIIHSLAKKLAQMPLQKSELTLTFSGQAGEPLVVMASLARPHFDEQSGYQDKPKTRTFHSHSLLTDSQKIALIPAKLNQCLGGIENNLTCLAPLLLDSLGANLALPFKEITEIKHQIVTWLNQGKTPLPEVTYRNKAKSLKRRQQALTSPVHKDKIEPKDKIAPARLAVLVDNEKRLRTLAARKNEVGLAFYYLLPSGLSSQLAKLIKLFTDNAELNLIPYFPSILINEDYDAAITLLNTVRPKSIVTNNSGVAWQAYQQGIKWLAGPEMNITNSQSMQALATEFDCAGAFISNELSRKQLEAIKPTDSLVDSQFELHYRVLCPSMLLTSRQCLFHQVTGCKKQKIDSKCLPKCNKHTQVLSLNSDAFVVDKQKGQYNAIYSPSHYLNLAIIDELSHCLDGLMLDFTKVSTNTQLKDKARLVELFAELIKESQNRQENQKSNKKPQAEKDKTNEKSKKEETQTSNIARLNQAIETQLVHFHNHQYEKGI